MAITLLPAGSATCGPGWRVTWFGLSGPVPLDDYIDVEVQSFGGHLNIIRGTAICHGFTSGTLTLGVDEVALPPYVSQVTPANGDNVLVFFEQLHANGTVVASGTSNWTWDATTGLWGLVAGPSSAGPAIAAIQAAVIRQLPKLP